MSVIEKIPGWYLRGWRKGLVFGGRATRGETWTFLLGNLLFGVVAVSAGELLHLDPDKVLAAWVLVTVVPHWAVMARRMHDADRSGSTAFAASILPLVGPPLLVWYLCEQGTVGPNRHGPDPTAPLFM